MNIKVASFNAVAFFWKLKGSFNKVDLIQKQDPYISCLQVTHLRPQDIQTESGRMEKEISYKWKSKEA